MRFKLNIQNFAAILYGLTINFDSGVEQVENNVTGSIYTVSGETKKGYRAGTKYLFTITLKSGYILDSVTSPTFTSNVEITNITSNTFQLSSTSDDAINVSITTKLVTTTQSETWVLNEELALVNATYTVNFTSNNTNFTELSLRKTKSFMSYGDIEVYSTSTGAVVWANEAYRTITFDTSPTGDLLTWLQANGTKQTTPTTGTIKLGSTSPTKYYLGNKAVDKIYMGTVLLYKKAIVYTITANLANCTAKSDNPITIEENGGAILYYTANDGYELPDGVELTNVGSYNWDKATGKLVIARPNGNVTIKIVAKQSMPQLATPQNVSVESNVASWDEVENAEQYDVYVDNTLIGNTTGEVSKTYNLTWDSRGYKIYVNDELIFDDYTSGSYTFKKGDIIKVDNWSNAGQITINGTAYTSTTETTLTDQDISITGSLPSTKQFTITINT